MKHTFLGILVYLFCINPLFSQNINAEIRTSQKEVINKVKDVSFRNKPKDANEDSYIDSEDVIVKDGKATPAVGFEWIAPFSSEDYRIKEINTTTLDAYDLSGLRNSYVDNSEIEYVESQKFYTVTKEKGEYLKLILEKIRKIEHESYTNIYKKVEKFNPKVYTKYYVEPTDKPGIHKIPRVPKGSKIVYGLNYGKRKKNKLNLLFTASSHTDTNNDESISYDEYTDVKRTYKFDEAFEIVFTYEIGTPDEIYFYYTLYDANDGNTIAEFEYSIKEEKACSRIVQEKIEAFTLPPGIYLLTIEMELIDNQVDENQLLMEEIEVIY